MAPADNGEWVKIALKNKAPLFGFYGPNKDGLKVARFVAGYEWPLLVYDNSHEIAAPALENMGITRWDQVGAHYEELAKRFREASPINPLENVINLRKSRYLNSLVKHVEGGGSFFEDFQKNPRPSDLFSPGTGLFVVQGVYGTGQIRSIYGHQAVESPRSNEERLTALLVAQNITGFGEISPKLHGAQELISYIIVEAAQEEAEIVRKDPNLFFCDFIFDRKDRLESAQK